MKLHVGNPAVREGLTVFPVFDGEAVVEAGYHLGGSAVAVEERAGAPVVGELVVTNRSEQPVLLLEGEVLEGGHQDRVLVRSVLVAAGAAEVVEVRCVEQGRWSGGRDHVRGARRAPVAVRTAGGQSEVWRRVGTYGSSTTGSLKETTGSRTAAADRLVRDLRPAAFQTGVLFGVGGHPLLLEVYDTPATLTAVWEGLLRGVAVDVVGTAAVGSAAVETPGYRARRFVRHLPRDVVAATPAGCGVELRGETAWTRQSVLRWGARTVHLTAVNARHQLVSA